MEENADDGEAGRIRARARPTWLKRILVSLIPTVPWMAAPFIAMEVLERNAIRGLYGNHDALMIPFFGLALMCVIGIPFFLIVLVFVQVHLGRDSCTFQTALTWRLPFAIALVAPAALLALAGMLSWWSIPHALIAMTYALPLVWLLWAVTVICRRPVRKN